MPELTIALTEEQFHDVACAAQLSRGLSVEEFVLRSVLEAAHEWVRNPEEVGLRVHDACRDLLARLE